MDELASAPVDADRRPVLAALGDTDAHDGALRFAADWAARQRRTLLLAHVVDLAEGMVAPEELLLGAGAARARAEALLESRVAQARLLTEGRVRVEGVLRFGPVVTELVGLSSTAGIVVLQRRRHAQVRHALMGSVSAGVASRAPVPVVSVPALWSGPGRTTRLAAAVDGTERNEAVIEWAFREAALLDATLTLVHAWFVPSVYQEAVIGRTAVNLSREATRLHIEEQLASWRSAFPSVDARLRIVHAQPVDALLEASRHADLLLVGRRRTHGMVHLGRLARSVLRKAECPVGVLAQTAPDSGAARRLSRRTRSDDGPTTSSSNQLMIDQQGAEQ
jgi:nucleotide-binding universal stress UspA family protein